MTDTTATYVVSKTPLGAQQYRAVIEVTETTNALDIELFVFETASDAFVSVATRYALEAYPNTKQQAIDDGTPYYRGATVLRDYPTVEGVEAFVRAAIERISYLCLSIDRIAMPFTATDTGIAPTILPQLPGGWISTDTGESLAEITIKAGDTLSLPMRWSVDGVYVDLTGYDIESMVRRRTDTTGGAPIDTLTCVADPDQVTNKGKFLVTATALQTATWPIAILVCDVKLDGGSDIRHTDVFEIEVLRPVTT